MSWLPDYPDFRDYTVEQDNISAKLKQLGQKDSVRGMLRKIGVTGTPKTSLPAAIDLRSLCSPIEDQDMLGSCTAHASVGLVEYFEKRASGKYLDASRLFLY
jgi:C1A family cysteine protease